MQVRFTQTQHACSLLAFSYGEVIVYELQTYYFNAISRHTCFPGCLLFSKNKENIQSTKNYGSHCRRSQEEASTFQTDCGSSSHPPDLKSQNFMPLSGNLQNFEVFFHSLFRYPPGVCNN